MRVATKRKSWPFSWPATFRKKWPVGARRCPMSAKAEAEAAAALRELGATMKASTNAPKLHTLKLLNELTPVPVQYSLGPAILLLFNTTRVPRGPCCAVSSTQRAITLRTPKHRSHGGPCARVTGLSGYSAKSPRSGCADRSCGLQSVAYLYVLSALCFKPLHV